VQPRRRARNLALQVLFEVDAVRHEPESAIHHRMEDEEGIVDEIERFARQLTWGVLNHQAEIDAFIQKHAPAWPLHEIAILDRNILRIGIFELLYEPATPPRVAINEAVELAKRFGNESSRRFVNGVLGATLTDLSVAGRLAHSTSTRAAAKRPRAVEPNE
jgi:N utilization substance protein B